MTNPISMTQPALALPQSIVTTGNAPSASGSYQDFDTLGIIITTAYDPSSFSYVTQALGQELNIADATSLYQSIGGYFGQPSEATFNLPDLSGRMALTLTGSSATNGVKLSGYSGTIAMGSVQGSYGSPVTLTQSQLPDSFGGSSATISNAQYGQGVSYIIQVYGDWPAAEGGIPNQSLGAIFPFVGDVIPKGFMLCSGQTIPLLENQALYAQFGNAYGGNPYAVTPTMGLPNLVNYIPIGAATGMDIGVISGSASPSISASSVNSGNAGTVSTLQPSLSINYLINSSGVTNSFNYYQPTLGEIIMFAGYQNSDDEWILCNGQLLKIASYQSLFNLIGTTFGGDGITTFAVPDLRGRTIVGSGGSSGLSIGNVVGQSTVTVTPDAIPDFVVPTVGVDLAEDTGVSSSDNVTSTMTLTVTGAWPSAVIQYSTDGVNWTSSFTAQQGSGVVYVRQVDPAGQASDASLPLSYVNDTTAPITPTVTIDYDTSTNLLGSSASGSNSLTTVSGSIAIQNHEMGATILYSIDGGTSWSEQFHAKEGLNSVIVKQVDVAGNVSTPSKPLNFVFLGTENQNASTTIAQDAAGARTIWVTKPGILDSSLGSSQLDTIVYHLEAPLVLPSSVEDVVLSGLGSGNTVTGNDSNNHFHVQTGSWVIQGGAGDDKLIVDGALKDYMVSQTGSGPSQAGVITLLGSDGKIVLHNVEHIIFSDTHLDLTSSSSTKAIYGLYQGLFDRMPDFVGLSLWRNAFDNGVSLSHIVDQFLSSPEYYARNGSASNDGALVKSLYLNALHRAPQASEALAWVNAIKGHAVTQQEVVIGIVGSLEAASKLPAQLLELV